MKNLIITLFILALCSCAPMTQELEQTGGPPSPPGQPAGTTIQTNSGTTLPATCKTGQMFIDTDADTNGSLYVCVATDTWKLDDDDGGAGGGTMTTVEEGDVQVGGNDIVTLDCGAGLDCTETPDTEINIVVDLSETGLGGTHDTSAELDAMYEVQLNNEAGLYAVLSDVSDFVQPAEVDVEMLSDVTGEGTAATYALFDDNDGTYSFRAIADGDVPDTITASNYAPLAGATFTDTVITDASDATASGLRLPHGAAPSAPTNGDLWTTTAGLYARINGGTVGPFGTGGATALDDVGDPDANNSISMAGYTDTRVSTTDGWGGLILHSNVANNASPTTLLTLQFDDANDSTNNSFLKIIEDADGTPATLFEFKGRTLTLGANASIEGISTITASTSVSPQSADGATLGTTALEWSDIYLADGGVIYFQNDQSVSLTPSASTLTLTGEMAATAGMDLGTSQALVGTTAMTIGNNAQTVAINSSDWDISATGDMTGIGSVTLDGDIIFPEKADHTSTPGAGYGYLWVKNDAPSSLVFTDDAGTDYDLTATGTLGSNLSSSTDDILSDNGTILLGGTGGTNNETLDLDFETTANTIALSTTSGATEIDAGSFQLVTTGDIMGAVNISSKTAATYTVGTDDASESYGTLFINGDNDAIDFTLPSAVAGMSACFMQGQGVSGAITVQPNTGDYLVVDGTRGTAATDYDSSGAGGDKLCVIAMDATDWIVTTEQGTWSE